MTRLIPLVIAGLLGMLLPVFIFCIARANAPVTVDAKDVSAIFQLALAKPLSAMASSKEGIVYVKSDEFELFSEALKSQHPTLKLLPWNKRPEDRGCEQTDPKLIVVAPCGRGDFVAASLQSLPLWRTALMSVVTFSSRGELVLIRLGETWHVVSQRWLFI